MPKTDLETLGGGNLVVHCPTPQEGIEVLRARMPEELAGGMPDLLVPKAGETPALLYGGGPLRARRDPVR